MGNYILGIDVGTSGCKTVVIDDKGIFIDSSRYEYPITSSQYGWAEQNPEDWYQAFKSGLKEIITRNPDIKKDIAAIGLTGQMVSLNLLDKDCKVIHPTIIWMDQRCLPQVNYLDKNYKKFLCEITFNPVGVQHTLPKILWVKENLPDVWDRVYKIQLSKDYIRFRLTGEWYTEYSDASATMLMDVKNLKWSEEIIDTFKIERSKLPDLLPSMAIAGYVNKTASEDLGIKEGIPVVAGAGDLAAENFAAGVTNFRQMATRLGTVANICTVVDEPIYYSGYFSTCCAYCIPGKWTLEVYDQAFGLCEKWYRDTFFKEEKERLEKENKDVYNLMDDMASEVPISL